MENISKRLPITGEDMITFSKTKLDSRKYFEIYENHYAFIEEWAELTDREQHVATCKFVSSRRNNLSFTAQSSCAIRTISRLDKYDNHPHCLTTTKRSRDLICWRIKKEMPKTETIDGIQVANCLDTICDLAKHDTAKSLLVSINDCLYKKYFTYNHLVTFIDKQKNRRHTKKLLKVIKFATNKCESPLETIALIEILRAGYVLPRQQIAIYEDNHFVARVDMFWQMRYKKIILEVDGKNKYSDATDLFNEKIREDKLRSMGYCVIRATWGDVISGKLIELLEKSKIPKRRYNKQTIFS